MTRQAFDVVVAGGGMAGASVAAALGELGYAVLVAEPGLDGAKRLAGELIHPPGAGDLSQLGLLPSLVRDLNAVVLGLREMLSRLLGEDSSSSRALSLRPRACAPTSPRCEMSSSHMSISSGSVRLCSSGEIHPVASGRPVG